MAKVNDDPKEKRILQLLGDVRPRSKYVISLLGSLPSTIGEAILLPKCIPIQELMVQPGCVRGMVLQFAKDLIAGLAFVHYHKIAHRDIKPDNLVYSATSGLQIIDFDVAVELCDGNQMVTDDVGTEGFKAPEIKDRNGKIAPYSPIKADRWSCGHTIQCFANYVTELDLLSLGALATTLIHEDPDRRAPLQELCEAREFRAQGLQ